RTLVDGACAHSFEDEASPSSLASPLGGRYPDPVDVELHAGEAATIYYALGGEEPTTASTSGPSPLLVPQVSGELAFFAIDEAGNRETVVHRESYAIDDKGPALSGIEVHPPDSTGAVVIAWPVPAAADFDGVLLVRDRSDPPSFAPAR